MKKIGFVTPWYGKEIPGGAEMELRGLVKHLQAAGTSLEVLTTCVEKYESDWSLDFYPEGLECVDGIDVRRFPVRKRNDAVINAINHKLVHGMVVSQEEEKLFAQEMIHSPALYKFMRENQEDYSLFVFIPYMFGTTVEGIRQAPHKAILLPCLHDERYAYMHHYKEIFPKVRGMIFHSKPESDLAHEIYDLTSVYTAVLGEGITTALDGDSKRFAEKYGQHAPFFIYAGRKDGGKNVDLLLSYFRKYKAYHRTPLKLLLIGGGSVAIPPAIKNDVLDLGFVPIQDKYDAMAAALFLCQPSINESFSLVIMESWLCRRPVLVHENCAVTKHFAETANGGLYFKNYWDFEKCIDYFLENQEESAILGSCGEKFVKDNFSWDIIVENYTNFFNSVSQ